MKSFVTPPPPTGVGSINAPLPLCLCFLFVFNSKSYYKGRSKWELDDLVPFSTLICIVKAVIPKLFKSFCMVVSYDILFRIRVLWRDEYIL